jgi:kynurenine formamidase
MAALFEMGFSELGIERCPPIITRGLLLDVPRSKEVDVLPDSYGITEDDLEACCERANVDIQPGDCVLIRTGFSRYRYAERVRFATVGAGPTPEACCWLAEQGISLTGSDTGIDPPPGNPDNQTGQPGRARQRSGLRILVVHYSLTAGGSHRVTGNPNCD